MWMTFVTAGRKIPQREKKSGYTDGTTGEKPNERLKEERLRPLPPPEAVVRYLTEGRRVSRDGFVSYEGAYYGIPWAFSGKHVGVVDLGFSVEVKHQGKRAALFPKARTRDPAKRRRLTP
jgi:hypothetical protein